MNIHEYQAKGVLSKYGVAVPRGKVADTPAEAEDIAKEFGTAVVVKAQIHAGGRGKGGGVKLARTADEVRTSRPRDARHDPASPTRPDRRGRLVTRVLVENGCNIANELYVSLVVDRGSLQGHRHGLHRRGDGHRRGRRQNPREDLHRERSIRWSA